MPGYCHSHLIPYLRLHPDGTHNMNLTTFGKRFFGSSTVNISGSSFTDVAGDSHTHYGSGDIVVYKNIPIIHPSQAGNQLRSYCSQGFRTLIMNTRLSLANHRRSCINGCRLQFPGARPSSSMPSWNEEGNVGGDRKMGQSW